MSIYKENMNTTQYINKDIKWDLLEYLFNQNFLNKNNKKDVIPKIIHQIWLGSELPDSSKILRDEMMTINKDFEYRLWTDKDVDEFGLKNKELYYNINNLGAKSDIFRYEILERIGGIYIDTDFKCYKSFYDLLHLDFWAGNGHIKEPEIFNSIIASKPNSKQVSAIVKELQKKTNFIDDIMGVMNNTGPYFISKVLFDNINENDNVVIFPTTFFFAFPAVLRHKKYDFNFLEQFKNKYTYCMHLWKTTWQKEI